MAVEDLDVWIQLCTDPATGCCGCRNLAAMGHVGISRISRRRLAAANSVMSCCFSFFLQIHLLPFYDLLILSFCFFCPWVPLQEKLESFFLTKAGRFSPSKAGAMLTILLLVFGLLDLMTKSQVGFVVFFHPSNRKHMKQKHTKTRNHYEPLEKSQKTIENI